MKVYKDCSDERWSTNLAGEVLCIHCGEVANKTRDHIPSRAFLVSPYPDNICTVPVCYGCNHDSAKDEEYVAYLVKWLKHIEDGAVEDHPTIDNFSHTDTLEDIMFSSLGVDEATGLPVVNIDQERVKKVLIKYAYSHICYECAEHPYGEPTHVACAFASDMPTRKCQ
jgi:hypothetical protein